MKPVWIKDFNYLPKMFREYYFHRRILHNDIEAILDMGCGYGCWLYILQRNNLLPVTTFGVDFDKSMLEIAGKNLKQVNLVHADATVCNFPDSPFDMAICNQVLEHTLDDEAVLRNINVSLKLGGALYVSSVIRSPKAKYFYKYKGETRLSPMHVKEYTHIADLAKLLIKSGFRLLQIEATPWRHKWGKVNIRVPGFYRVEALVLKEKHVKPKEQLSEKEQLEKLRAEEIQRNNPIPKECVAKTGEVIPPGRAQPIRPRVGVRQPQPLEPVRAEQPCSGDRRDSGQPYPLRPADGGNPLPQGTV